jgi:hypothetical protein
MNTIKVRPGYLLHQIEGESYLLPYGQNIADHRRGLKLNASGVFLWALLQETTGEDELLVKSAKYYQAKPCEWPRLLGDIRSFLNELSYVGILYTEEPLPAKREAMLQFGPIRMAFYGPGDFLTKELHSFLAADPDTALPPHCTVTLYGHKPTLTINGSILLRNQDFLITESEEHYLFLYESTAGLLECHLAKDFTRANFYYLPPITPDLVQHFFHALRPVFLTIAQRQGLFVLHSASVLYRGKAWLFSGKSGTGKTTHTNMWKELYQTKVLNGDLNMIGTEDGQAVIYGLPWCGTSGLYTAEQYPLGGIILLKQGPVNKLLPLTTDSRILFLVQRLISPDWTVSLMEKNIRFARQTDQQVPIMRLMCTKDPAAVDTIKCVIDGIESGGES